MVINKYSKHDVTLPTSKVVHGVITSIKRCDDYVFAIELAGVDDKNEARRFNLLFTNEEMVRIWKAAESL